LRKWVRRAEVQVDIEGGRLDADDEPALADIKRLRKYERWIASLKEAFSSVEKEFTPFLEGDKKDSIVVRPLDARGFLTRLFGNLVERVVFVSATPGKPDMVEQTMGLDQEPKAREYGTPFPKEMRPIIFENVCSLNMRSSEADYRKMIDRVIELIGFHKDRGEKGVLHTYSRALHTKFVAAIRRAHSDVKVYEIIGSKNRRELTDQFKMHQGPALIVGPAITDGMDLKDDTCRYGILPKVPWPALGDPTVKHRKDLFGGIGWYEYQAILSIIQACGRNVRSKDDWATNYILDGAFKRLWFRHDHHFPEWFREAVHLA